MTNVLKRRRESTEEKHSETQRKQCKEGAKTGVMLPHAQECLDQQNSKESRKDSPLKPLEGAWTGGNLDFGLLISKTMEGQTSVVLNYQVYGDVFTVALDK